MKKIYLLGMCLAALLFTACGSSVQIMSYEQLIPSVVNYPEEVRKVGIVNNLPADARPSDRKLTIGILSPDGKIAAEAFAEAVADANYFDETLISDSILRKNDTSAGMRLLTPSQVDALAEAMGVDMIFSFDALTIRTRKDAVMDWELGPVEVVAADVTPLIHIYLPGRSHPLYTVSKSDSVYFYLTHTLNDRTIVEEASRSAARVPVDYLLPHWRTAERCMFSGGSVQMRDAAVWAKEGDWAEARKLWTEQYETTRNAQKKMRAAYNIALSHEMEGNPAEGVKWLEKAEAQPSQDVADRRLLEYYKKELTRRAEDLGRLNVQMQRFE